ncbi:MAG: hypothetical protein GDA56_23370 [Hormoscilla sp. GM7CHS1pb]|nr:hypothetical protein [Hormoscilla sp. GM7CHS1pb]
MKIIICPGIHDRALTESFLQKLELPAPALIFPASGYSPVSAVRVWQFLRDNIGEPGRESFASGDTHPCHARERHDRVGAPGRDAIISICFSAGVVGAIGAAWQWQMWGGKVKACFALDGWGVPLLGNFPIHRLSHDYFTHWSSRLLGTGEDSFYANPPVAHLELWREPDTVSGWWQLPDGNAQRTTASEFLTTLLQRYCTNHCQ